MERLPPGVGAASERPMQGPVVSLGVGLERLRQLGWDWSEHYDQYYRAGLLVSLVALAILVTDMSFSAYDGRFSVVCTSVGVAVLAVILMATYRYLELARRTDRMVTRRVVAPRGHELGHVIESALASIGFQYNWVVPRQGTTLSVRILTRTYHVCRLPQLSAALMVGVGADVRQGVRATTLMLGPVTAENVGGLVRMAEALERHLRGART